MASGGFDDIFSSIFGGAAGARVNDPNAPVRGKDLEVHVKISFKESYLGVKKNISFTRTEKCNICSGSGAKKGTTPETCHTCNGKGRVSRVTQTMFGATRMETVCETCHGTGKEIKEKCDTCHGKGQVNKSVDLTVNIPAGVADGNTILMREEGADGKNGGSKGDLHIIVSVEKDKIYERKGDDVYIEIPISYTKAVLGGDVEIPLVDGTVEKYKIKEGTPAGAKYKVKGKGFKHPNSNVTGDLYFIIDIDIPKKITKEQRELLEKLALTFKEDLPPKKKGIFENLF